MKKLVGLVALLVALALPSFAAAQVPVPVDTDLYDGGVYVQPITLDRVLVACHVHIWTLHGTVDGVEYDSVGEEIVGVVTTADFESTWVDSATVWRVTAPGTRDVVAGRAVFTIPAGAYLDTVNTDPTLTAVCPAG